MTSKRVRHVLLFVLLFDIGLMASETAKIWAAGVVVFFLSITIILATLIRERIRHPRRKFHLYHPYGREFEDDD